MFQALLARSNLVHHQAVRNYCKYYAILEEKYESLLVNKPNFWKKYDKQTLEEIGNESYGIVYRVNGKDNGKDFALKIHKRYNPEDSSVAKDHDTLSFLSEVYILDTITRESVTNTTLYGVWKIPVPSKEDKDVVAIALNYHHGVSLSKFGQITSLEQWLNIAIPLASQLRRLHQHGIVHCDINHRNIIVHSNDLGVYSASLIDFGMANLESTPLRKLNTIPECLSAKETGKERDIQMLCSTLIIMTLDYSQQRRLHSMALYNANYVLPIVHSVDSFFGKTYLKKELINILKHMIDMDFPRKDLTWMLTEMLNIREMLLKEK